MNLKLPVRFSRRRRSGDQAMTGKSVKKLEETLEVGEDAERCTKDSEGTSDRGAREEGFPDNCELLRSNPTVRRR